MRIRRRITRVRDYSRCTYIEMRGIEFIMRKFRKTIRLVLKSHVDSEIVRNNPRNQLKYFVIDCVKQYCKINVGPVRKQYEFPDRRTGTQLAVLILQKKKKNKQITTLTITINAGTDKNEK